jgi:hypothetical protein
MGLITWIAIAVIALVVIGLGAGVFFSGLIRGAEIIVNNPAVQNITQEAKEFLNSNIQESSISSSVLVITTDEARYRISQPVTITVKNIGDETLTFSDSALGLKFQNTKFQNTNTGQMYGVATAKVMTELIPGASKTITWNQQDGSGNNVPAGDYTATVQTIPSSSSSSSQSVSAQVSFKITG